MQIKIKMNKSDENASSGARFDGCPVVVVKLCRISGTLLLIIIIIIIIIICSVFIIKTDFTCLILLFSSNIKIGAKLLPSFLKN